MKCKYPNITKTYEKLLKCSEFYQNLGDYLIESIFSIILDFWYEEVIPNKYINWTKSIKQKKFYNWLKKTIKYIEKERIKKLKQINNEYLKINKKFKFKENNNEFYYMSLKDFKKYFNKINKIEKELDIKDKKILKEIINNYFYFWV